MRTLWVAPQRRGGFIREWLLCGSFAYDLARGAERKPDAPAPPLVGLDTDYLTDHGGEDAIRPVPGMTHERPDGTRAAWFAHASGEDIVDLNAAFGVADSVNVVAYAYAVIHREEAGEGVITVGSDDGVRVWLNGRLVHDNLVGRSVRLDADVIPVSFRKGENAILLKIQQGRGDWGFACRALSVARALALEEKDIQPRILDAPGEKPQLLVVGTDFGLCEVVDDPEPVRVEATAPGGRIVGLSETKRGETVRFDTSQWADGPYEVHVSKRTPEGHRMYKHLSWYKGDWLKQVVEMLKEADGFPQGATDPTALRLRLLADYFLEWLGGDPREEQSSADEPAPSWPALTNRMRDLLLEHREIQLGDVGGCRHGFEHLAWIDEIDGSPQFARVAFPANYDPKGGEKYPLVVYLHGYYWLNPTYLHWYIYGHRQSVYARRRNVIVVEAHGRGNAWFRGIGERDVMRAVEEAKRKYPVDEDRIYLTGVLMGGHGTWHVGSRRPGIFAAIGPLFGGWHYGATMEAEQLAGLSPRQRFHLEGQSSYAQAEALIHTPIFVSHGALDGSVLNSQSAVRMLQRWGYNVFYWEFPDKAHEELPCTDEMIDWLLEHRLECHSRRVRLRAARLRTATADWVRVEQRDDPFAFVQVDALAERINAKKPDGNRYTVISILPDSDWDSSMWDASFVEWVGADTPLDAAQAGRIEATRKRLIPEDPEDEDAVNRAAEDFASDIAILAIFSGWLPDQYNPEEEGQDHGRTEHHSGDE
ncbi:MAG TPA: prolyl oligopeptidase family serine peptidase [Sumerlaeia bacterium]|nr:prolyl oligopeptidase family serine peptidase [Sumerlaeia bacterium]